MSVTYGGTTLPEAKTDWGPPTPTFKSWGYFGGNGEDYLHGGTRGRRFSVSGICPVSLNSTIEGWFDGTVRDAVIDGTTYSNTLMVNVEYGNRFKDGIDSTQYNRYTVYFLQLRT